MTVNGKIWDFLEERHKAGATLIALRGPRRAGKTWTASQFLLDKGFSEGDKIIFASMTEMQGDAGAFDDCRNIIYSNPSWVSAFDITRSPRKIECRVMRDSCRGQLLFRSFRDAQTAKGLACDWVFMNEANAFTLDQYYTISANARKGVIADFNPNSRFWLTDLVKPEDELHVRWEWNRRYLTAAQIQWYSDVTARAMSPDATAADIYYYRVYVLGEYAEMEGAIFTPNRLQRVALPCKSEVRHVRIYSDPSAMVGADYFASVLTGVWRDKLIVLDAYSVNDKGREDILGQWREWHAQYDIEGLNVETNGYIGQEFYKYAKTAFGKLKPYNNGANKQDRIMANYENITQRVVFANTPAMDSFLEQVYAFENKKTSKAHDDNIDAVNSAWEIAHTYFRYL